VSSVVNIDDDQNIRLRIVEEKVQFIEVRLSVLQAQLTQATNILKIIAIGVGMTLGIDLQGMII
tara:strand:- start:2367 stop:2558 length:192 start_codon:yes stop_codon:yes gene_type:complete